MIQYYPPDFDPTKLPKLKVEKRKQYTVRIMTPFNMKCNTCGDYISKAKKFNARKETIENETYLNLKVFRFYIKCPKCMSEITFKTNPQTSDYEMEFGAHRCFDALRLAMLQEEDEIEREKEEEKLNPMKLLENRTKQSKEEMEEIEKLSRLKEENATKQGVDVNNLIEVVQDKKDEKKLLEELKKAEEAEDERTAKELLKLAQNRSAENVDQIKSTTNLKLISNNLFTKTDKPTNHLTSDTEISSRKRKLEGLVSVKKKQSDKIELTVETEDKKPKLFSSLCNYSDSSEEDC